MEPVGYGILFAIAASAGNSVLLGAVIGAAVWRLRWGLPLGGLGAGVYLVVAARSIHFAFLAFAAIFAPPLVMSLLASYLTGRYLGGHRHVRFAWATLAALGVGLVFAALYLLLLRARFPDDLWTPAWAALGVDVCLALLAIQWIRGQRRGRP